MADGDYAWSRTSLQFQRVARALTTAQMSDPKSFIGWDFGRDGAWATPAGATHPVLRWQVEH